MNHRAPELNPLLQGTPTLETYTARVLQRLYEDINLMLELAERLKAFNGLREPDKYGEQYTPDQHLRLIEEGRYSAARALIVTRGR
jgi:hypothetical protein